MDRKNRYFTFSKISEARFRHLVRCFAMDLTATETSVFTGLSVRTVNAVFLRIRQRLTEACERESPLSGTLEVDESYFGPHRIRGKRGWRWWKNDRLRTSETRRSGRHGNCSQCEKGCFPGGDPGQGRSGESHSHRRMARV